MNDTFLTDDYVASILQRDANRSSQNRYLAASGLGSLLGGSRPRNSNAPKPNTRFLKNIVRDVDSHNAALKRKEEEESRARLRKLRHEERGSSHRDRNHERDDERHRKRKEGLSSREKDLKSRRHRSRSRERRADYRRSRSPRRDTTHSRRERGDILAKREQQPTTRVSRHETDSGEENDSDPLESLVGPAPPPSIISRGRGAHKSSDINSRFDPKYDPKADVALENSDEGDDWDMALEALRDRAKWRKSGAERLSAAGFTEDEVSTWAKGGGSKGGGSEEKDVGDVRWSKKGEGREWDRGKVVDGARVDVKAEWGRLKDT